MIGQIHVPMNSIDLGQVYEDWRDLEPANDDKVNKEKIKFLIWLQQEWDW